MQDCKYFFARQLHMLEEKVSARGRVLNLNKEGEMDVKTAIMTDTNSGITVKEGTAQGIYVLPMPVIVDEVSYMECVDITHKQLFQFLQEDRDVSTSQPSPGDLLAMWDQIFADGYDEIVYLPMSSGLSSSCQTANQFAVEYEGKVQVVDNHRISVTLRSSVHDAKRLAQRGKSAKEIKEILEEHAYEASIYITVNSLKYLKKSGRVTPAGAALADALNLKPVLTIQGEKLDAFAKVRGSKSSEKKMIEALKQDLETRFKDYPKESIALWTAGTFADQAEADAWLTKVKEAFPGYPVVYNPLSCNIACHVGVDAKGIGICEVL